MSINTNFNGEVPEFQRLDDQNAQTKPLIQSVTAWGGVSSILGSLTLGLAKIAFLPALGPLGVFLGVGGGVASILGRILAEKPIVGLFRNPSDRQPLP